jgi:hypothetical protein
MIVFNSRVMKLEQKSQIKRAWKDEKNETHTEVETTGWFLHLDGLGVGLWCGLEKPESLAEGDLVTLTVARRRL